MTTALVPINASKAEQALSLLPSQLEIQKKEIPKSSPTFFEVSVVQWKGRGVTHGAANLPFAPFLGGDTQLVPSLSHRSLVPQTSSVQVQEITTTSSPNYNQKTIVVEKKTITRDDVDDIAKNFPNLAELILISCTIEENCFTPLATFTNFKSLVMRSCSMSEDALGGFLHLKKIEKLVITGNTFDDNQIRFLLAFLSLKHLELSNCQKLSPQKLKLLSELTPNLETLKFFSMPLSDHFVRELPRLNKLRNLSFTQCKGFSVQTMGFISKVSTLTSLEFVKCPLTDELVNKLTENSSSSIQSLTITGATDLSSQGVQNITNFPNLRSLNLSHSSKIDDKALDVIAKIAVLTFLDLSYTQITDTGAAKIAPLGALQVLRVNDCHALTDKSIPSFAKLLNLRHLIIRNCEKISNSGIEKLTPLVKLISLDASYCSEITADAFKTLANKLEKLQRLYLNSCPLLTTGDMTLFANFSDLNVLSLHHTFDNSQEKREFILDMSEKKPALLIAHESSTI